MLAAWDQELDAARAAEVREHLDTCPTCRERWEELQTAFAEFTAMHERAPLLGGGEAGIRFRARLGARQQPRRAGLAAVAAAVATVAVAVIGLGWLSERRAVAASLPDTRLTPGWTRAVSPEQLCRAPFHEEDRTVPEGLALEVFRQYGIAKPAPGAYEVDYLITPALGGAEDARNLWPQPYADGVWNARVKDALEDYLHRAVCSGSMKLAMAQQEIARDWVAAYRKHFRTRRPLAAHAAFAKDRPWQGAVH